MKSGRAVLTGGNARISSGETREIASRAVALGAIVSQLFTVIFCVFLAVAPTTQVARAATWGTIMDVSADAGTEFQTDPTIAVGNGKIHVAWEDRGGGDPDIKYRFFDGTSWQPVMELSSDPTPGADSFPSIATDGNEAHAVWSDGAIGPNFNLMYRYFDGATWQPEVDISDDIASEWQFFPSIAAEGGNVYVAWMDQADGDWDIYYRYFDGLTWRPKQEISADVGAEEQHKPSIAVEGGKVHVVWQNGWIGSADIYYRFFDGITWQPEVELSTDTANEDQHNPSISVEGGKAYVVWQDEGDGDWDVFYRHFDGVTWQPEVELSTDAAVEDQINPVIVTKGGVIHVAWQDADPAGGNWDVFYKCYTGVLWKKEQQISADWWPPMNAHERRPDIAVEGSIVHAVWQDQNDGDNDIYYRSGDFTDFTQPDSSMTPVSPYWQNTSAFDVGWMATDDTDLHKITLYYRYSPDNSTWSGWTAWDYNVSLSGTTASGSFTFDTPQGDGYYEFYTIAGDLSWNHEPDPMAADTIAGVDSTPPAGSIVINSGGESWTNSSSVILALSYSDGLTGVSGVRYSNDGVWDTEPWEQPTPTKAWALASGDGTKTVYYQVKDNVSLESVVYSDDIVLDTTPPTGSIQINNGDAWTNATLANLALTFTDNHSGVSQVRYSNDGVWDIEPWEPPSPTKTWDLTAGDGMKTVYYQMKDYVGQTSVTYSDDIGLDSEPPTGSIIINNGDQWTPSASVTLTLTYSDTLSGVSQIRFGNDGVWNSETWETPTPTKAWGLFFGDGPRTVYYQVKDNATSESITYTDDINLDSTPPTGSVVMNNGNPTTNSTSVSLSLTYSDAGSGISQVRYSNDGVWDIEPWEPPSPTKIWTLEAGDGAKTVYYQIRDNASGESITYSDSIVLDGTPPIGLVIINSGDVWTDTLTVSLTLTYSDNLTGVSQVRYSNDGVWDTEPWEQPTPTKAWALASGDGVKTVYYQIIDNASTEITVSDDIILDTTLPSGSIVISDGSDYTNTTFVTLTLSYSDGQTGVHQVRYSNDGVFDIEPWESPAPTKNWVLTSGEGLKTVYFEIKDEAGWIGVNWDEITLDTTQPTGSIEINQGVDWATSISVELTLTYSDALSGVSQVRYGNDDIWDTEPWESPSATRTWTISVDDGYKTVFYQIIDNAGLTFTVFDAINLDTTSPDIVNTVPLSGKSGIRTSTDITIYFSEEMNESATEDSLEVIKDGKEIQGTITWSDDKKTLVFNPSSDLKEGTKYRVVLATSAMDVAGNNLDSAYEASFTTEGSAGDSFLVDYWWIFVLIAVIILISLLAVRSRRRTPVEEGAPESEEDAQLEESDESA